MGESILMSYEQSSERQCEYGDHTTYRVKQGTPEGTKTNLGVENVLDRCLCQKEFRMITRSVSFDSGARDVRSAMEVESYHPLVLFCLHPGLSVTRCLYVFGFTSKPETSCALTRQCLAATLSNEGLTCEPRCSSRFDEARQPALECTQSGWEGRAPGSTTGFGGLEGEEREPYQKVGRKRRDEDVRGM